MKNYKVVLDNGTEEEIEADELGISANGQILMLSKPRKVQGLEPNSTTPEIVFMSHIAKVTYCKLVEK
jgi:hypothetical protein